jgi:hypothetical protein
VIRIGILRSLSLLLSLSSCPMIAGELCGSKEGYFNVLASTYLVPDYFPPENELARLVSDRDIKRCEDLGSVYLGQVCADHDACYIQKQPKNTCDRALQDRWVRQCREVYHKLSTDHLACRLACEVFVKLMSEAQRYNENGFCPSCDAYDAS